MFWKCSTIPLGSEPFRNLILMPLTFQEVFDFAPALAALEEDEPIVSVWRNSAGKSARPPLNCLREVAHLGRDFVLRTKTLERPKRGQIVVLSYSSTPATLGTLLPVMSELHRQGRPVFFVFTSKTAHVLEQNLHSGCASLLQILATVPICERLKLRELARLLAQSVQSVLIDEQDGRAQTWIETGLVARSAAQHWLPSAGALIADADTDPTRKGFFLSAARAGVPSFILQHGTLDLLNFPMHADEFLSWGEFFRKQAVEFGVDDRRAIAVGCPRWDALSTERRDSADPCIRAALGGNADRPLVLLISQAHAVAMHPGYFDAVFDGLTRLLTAGIDIAIKLHPAESGLDAYRRRVPEALFQHVRAVPPEIGLVKALLNADVAYHAFSAAAMDAMLLGVPVLFEKEYNGKRLCDFPDFGGGVWVSPDDIVEHCRALTRDSSERKAVLKKQETFLGFALANRGKAAEATAHRVLSMARN
jgi:hypothetical protein